MGPSRSPLSLATWSFITRVLRVECNWANRYRGVGLYPPLLNVLTRYCDQSRSPVRRVIELPTLRQTYTEQGENF